MEDCSSRYEPSPPHEGPGASMGLPTWWRMEVGSQRWRTWGKSWNDMDVFLVCNRMQPLYNVISYIMLYRITCNYHGLVRFSWVYKYLVTEGSCCEVMDLTQFRNGFIQTSCIEHPWRSADMFNLCRCGTQEWCSQYALAYDWICC